MNSYCFLAASEPSALDRGALEFRCDLDHHPVGAFPGLARGIRTIMKHPDIIIFNPDQWRGDVLGHMGNPAAVTPHLDRLVAGEAVSFRNAFCQNPVCTPSRCSFKSGWNSSLHTGDSP
jgi:hypothetical protein